MFCENCGRPIEPGEICTCMQQSPLPEEPAESSPVTEEPAESSSVAEEPAESSSVTETSSGISLVLESPDPVEPANTPDYNPVIRFLGSPLILLFAFAELARIVFDIVTTVNGTSVFSRVGIIPEFIKEGSGKVYSVGLVIILSILPSVLVLAALITFINARSVRNTDRPMASAGLSLFSAYCNARIFLDLAVAIIGAYLITTVTVSADGSFSFIFLIPAGLIVIDLFYYFLLNRSVKGLRFNACKIGKPQRVSFVPAIVMMILMVIEVLIAVSFHFITYILNAFSDLFGQYFNLDYLMNDVISVPKFLRTFNFTSSIEESISVFIDKTTELINKLFTFDSSEAANLWISTGLSILALIIAVIAVFRGRSAQKRANNI